MLLLLYLNPCRTSSPFILIETQTLCKVQQFILLLLLFFCFFEVSVSWSKHSTNTCATIYLHGPRSNEPTYTARIPSVTGNAVCNRSPPQIMAVPADGRATAAYNRDGPSPSSRAPPSSWSSSSVGDAKKAVPPPSYPSFKIANNVNCIPSTCGLKNPPSR